MSLKIYFLAVLYGIVIGSFFGLWLGLGSFVGILIGLLAGVLTIYSEKIRKKDRDTREAGITITSIRSFIFWIFNVFSSGNCSTW